VARAYLGELAPVARVCGDKRSTRAYVGELAPVASPPHRRCGHKRARRARHRRVRDGPERTMQRQPSRPSLQSPKPTRGAFEAQTRPARRFLALHRRQVAVNWRGRPGAVARSTVAGVERRSWAFLGARARPGSVPDTIVRVRRSGIEGGDLPGESGELAGDRDRDHARGLAALGANVLPALMHPALGAPCDLDDSGGPGQLGGGRLSRRSRARRSSAAGRSPPRASTGGSAAHASSRLSRGDRRAAPRWRHSR
jgi:hypothetical protein